MYAKMILMKGIETNIFCINQTFCIWSHLRKWTDKPFWNWISQKPDNWQPYLGVNKKYVMFINCAAHLLNSIINHDTFLVNKHQSQFCAIFKAENMVICWCFIYKSSTLTINRHLYFFFPNFSFVLFYFF